MEIHRHMLVFIYLVTKKILVLGLTRVDFYHSFTYLISMYTSARVAGEYQVGYSVGTAQRSFGQKMKCLIDNPPMSY